MLRIERENYPHGPSFPKTKLKLMPELIHLSFDNLINDAILLTFLSIKPEISSSILKDLLVRLARSLSQVSEQTLPEEFHLLSFNHNVCCRTTKSTTSN